MTVKPGGSRELTDSAKSKDHLRLNNERWVGQADLNKKENSRSFLYCWRPGNFKLRTYSPGRNDFCHITLIS